LSVCGYEVASISVDHSHLLVTDKQVAKKYETFVLNHTLGTNSCLTSFFHLKLTQLENLGGELIWCPKVFSAVFFYVHPAFSSLGWMW
jgi:hypothetical protein